MLTGILMLQFVLCLVNAYHIAFRRFDLLFIYSASHCDIDDNGVQHLVFCRVILGNVELLHPGSRQFHPSSKDFDCGVDNLKEPTYYVVWRMNMSTHIYPESVVSFKVAPSPKGDHLPWFTVCWEEIVTEFLFP